MVGIGFRNRDVRWGRPIVATILVVTLVLGCGLTAEAEEAQRPSAAAIQNAGAEQRASFDAALPDAQAREIDDWRSNRCDGSGAVVPRLRVGLVSAYRPSAPTAHASSASTTADSRVMLVRRWSRPWKR